MAVSYLKKQGYGIINRNYRTRLGEIDIIGEDKGCVCFIEVRSKNSAGYGSPEDTITRVKQRRLEKTALAYIKRFKLADRPCRFDVIAIKNTCNSNPDIRLIKNAFELNERYKY